MSDPVKMGTGKALRATEKAVLVRFDADDYGTRWIPKTAIHDDSEVYDLGHEGEVVVESWYAAKQRWI